MNYWLVKSEPAAYAWAQFVKDGGTAWTGVRNFQERNNLRAMKKGDQVCFYHSVTEKQVVGLVPVKAFARPVTLNEIKADKILSIMPLLKQSPLSVTPLTPQQFERLLKLARA